MYIAWGERERERRAGEVLPTEREKSQQGEKIKVAWGGGASGPGGSQLGSKPR